MKRGGDANTKRHPRWSTEERQALMSEGDAGSHCSDQDSSRCLAQPFVSSLGLCTEMEADAMTNKRWTHGKTQRKRGAGFGHTASWLVDLRLQGMRCKRASSGLLHAHLCALFVRIFRCFASDQPPLCDCTKLLVLQRSCLCAGNKNKNAAMWFATSNKCVAEVEREGEGRHIRDYKMEDGTSVHVHNSLETGEQGWTQGKGGDAGVAR